MNTKELHRSKADAKDYMKNRKASVRALSRVPQSNHGHISGCERCRGAGRLLSWRAEYALSRRRASAVVARRVRQRDVSSSDSDSAT
jgi:hypothetical protein